MHVSRNALILFLGLSLFTLRPGDARGEDDFDLDSLQTEILETIDRVRPAVVNILGGGTGFSGVIVSPDGKVLSAGHAVRPGTQYRIMLPDGRRLRGVGKGSNARTDSALIQITNPGDDLPYVPMGDSSSLVPNQPCIGLSYPGGQKAGREPVVRFGRMMSAGRSRGMLQSSALMEPGDSGGPLFDLNGYVIGIHSRIGRSMWRNYEVPVNVYREFWNEHNYERAFVSAGPPMPKLGVRCTPARDEENEGEFKGIRILRVENESLASKAGIKEDDTIMKLHGRELQTLSDLREALIAARDEEADSLEIVLMREDETLDLQVEFDVEREAAPDVPLPKVDHPSVPTPRSFRELNGLAKQLAELEAKLDDACVEIISEVGDEDSTSIIGTRIADTAWIVSKSSVVGSNPKMTSDDEPIELEIVERDRANDLVLLKAPEVSTDGINFDSVESGLAAGTFLLTPDADGDGDVSVVGSRVFRSRKFSSRGFLGVVPTTFENNKGALLNEVTEDGAAKRAGLLVGDVVTKLNDTVIRTQQDMRNFLSKADPNAVITATLRRDEDELTKSITLGAVPSSSRHAADQMAKSGRRDGFNEVFPHDANLSPSSCGGPLFDLEGRFVGLNIARNSRVRSFALPASALKEFVDAASEEIESASEGAE
ncbi:MAG: trypsin-like peptidase domain-containing protein [Planctomycetota bacterium]